MGIAEIAGSIGDGFEGALDFIKYLFYAMIAIAGVMVLAIIGTVIKKITSFGKSKGGGGGGGTTVNVYGAGGADAGAGGMVQQHKKKNVGRTVMGVILGVVVVAGIALLVVWLLGGFKGKQADAECGEGYARVKGCGSFEGECVAVGCGEDQFYNDDPTVCACQCLNPDWELDLGSKSCIPPCPSGAAWDPDVGKCICFVDLADSCGSGCCPAGFCTETENGNAVCCNSDPQDPFVQVCNGFCCGGGTVCENGQCVSPCGPNNNCGPGTVCMRLSNVDETDIADLTLQYGVDPDTIAYGGGAAFICLEPSDCIPGEQWAAPAPQNQTYPCMGLTHPDTSQVQAGIGYCTLEGDWRYEDNLDNPPSQVQQAQARACFQRTTAGSCTGAPGCQWISSFLVENVEDVKAINYDVQFAMGQELGLYCVTPTFQSSTSKLKYMRVSSGCTANDCLLFAPVNTSAINWDADTRVCAYVQVCQFQDIDQSIYMDNALTGDPLDEELMESALIPNCTPSTPCPVSGDRACYLDGGFIYASRCSGVTNCEQTGNRCYQCWPDQRKGTHPENVAEGVITSIPHLECESFQGGQGFFTADPRYCTWNPCAAGTEVINSQCVQSVYRPGDGFMARIYIINQTGIDFDVSQDCSECSGRSAPLSVLRAFSTGLIEFSQRWPYYGPSGWFKLTKVYTDGEGQEYARDEMTANYDWSYADYSSLDFTNGTPNETLTGSWDNIVIQRGHSNGTGTCAGILSSCDGSYLFYNISNFLKTNPYGSPHTVKTL